MSTKPRIIAATAAAAMLAATGAGTAVIAVDTVTSDQNQTTADATTSDTLQSPQDDSTTVYRAPQDDSPSYDEDESGSIKPAPPSTSFQGSQGQPGKSNTSKSS
jgi:hypothetical protein